MRWLQWSSYDLSNGMGGVEMHARCLQRELRKKQIDAHLSQDPKDLESPAWDVIHTHGSSILPNKIPRHPKTKYVHTLHGTTLGRMGACGEWLWPGGYLAYLREIRAIQKADVVLSVHEGLHLYEIAKTIGKKAAVCSNGWDSGTQPQELAPQLAEQVQSQKPFYTFVGRGGDPVKNTGLIEAANLKVIAIPGEGFASTNVKHVGRLAPEQIITVLRQSQGLLLTSHYEGLPLVVLEALGDGVPVYSTCVGGLNHLPADLLGITFLEPKAESWKTLPAAKGSRESRAQHNRALLKSWAQVAQAALDAVTS